MSFVIVTDTCCNLPEEVVLTNNLKLIPLSYVIDNTSYASYTDSRPDDLSAFYALLRAGKLVTTSMASRAAIDEVLRPLIKDHHDILYIGFSSVLSGTYNNVAQAMKDYQNEQSDRSPEMIAIDSKSASGGQGLLVQYACTLRAQGLPIQEVAQRCSALIDHIAHWIVVDDLSFLVRGGRLSRTQGLVGSALSVKPIIICNEEGALESVDKVRGRKRVFTYLLDMLEKHKLDDTNDYGIYICDGDCRDEAELLRDEIIKRTGFTNIILTSLDPVLGAHTGPGTLTLFFVSDARRDS